MKKKKKDEKTDAPKASPKESGTHAEPKKPAGFAKVGKAKGKRKGKKGAAKAKRKSKKGRKPARETRELLWRIGRYHTRFARDFRDKNPGKRLPNATELGVLGNCTRYTVYRTIEAMQDDHNLPVDILDGNEGYGYTEEVTNLPAVQFSQGELIAIFAALNALKSIRGNPFDEAARSAFEKLAIALVEAELTIDLDALESVICFRTGGFPTPADQGFIEQATRAAMAREELVLHYAKFPLDGGKPVPKVHRVRPYFLLCAGEAWYLYTYDLDAGDKRRFAFSRMLGMEGTGRHFALPPGFDREKMIGSGFGTGLFGDDHPVEVKLRFTGRVARVISEKIWHETQELEFLGPPDDREREVELRMKVSNDAELQNWVRSWGKAATVLGPRELAEAVAR